VLGDMMQDKVEFLKWIFKNINYFYIALFFHLVICFSFVFLPKPFDKVAAVYILITLSISAIYYLIILPLTWAYAKFKLEKKRLNLS
jgi:hypothetical protein